MSAPARPGCRWAIFWSRPTLFHLLEERYHHVALPTQPCPLNTVEDLQALVEAWLTRISTTSALFQMFGVLGDALDPGGDGQCVAFIHPVMRHYSNGQMIKDVHMQSGVFVRYDRPNETFALEFNSEKPKNLMMNFINSVARVSDRIFAIKTFTDGQVGGFTPWPPDRRYEDPGLPKCLRTHSPNFVPDPAQYL